MMRVISCLLCFAVALGCIAGKARLAASEPPAALTPEEARQKVGEQVEVEMTVKAAKDRLEKRGEVYLDSELDFRSPQNFAVVITRQGAASLAAAGVSSPAEHFREKRIRAKGTVKFVDDVPRIEVESSDQIQLVPSQP